MPQTKRFPPRKRPASAPQAPRATVWTALAPACGALAGQYVPDNAGWGSMIPTIFVSDEPGEGTKLDASAPPPVPRYGNDGAGQWRYWPSGASVRHCRRPVPLWHVALWLCTAPVCPFNAPKAAGNAGTSLIWLSTMTIRPPNVPLAGHVPGEIDHATAAVTVSVPPALGNRCIGRQRAMCIR
jgi:hypothetical protein